MDPRPKPYLSPEQYLAAERGADRRSEYFDGEMFAMTGGSRAHNLVVTNLVGELRQQLKGRSCELYPSDLRVRVSATGLYTYPDIVAVCGEPRFDDDEQADTLLNPTLIVEVLSPTTEAYDRGRKFEHYRTLASLQEYLLVSQEVPRIEQFLRQDDGHWLFTAASGLETDLALPSIGCRILLAEVYDKVAFTPTGPRSS